MIREPPLLKLAMGLVTVLLLAFSAGGAYLVYHAFTVGVLDLDGFVLAFVGGGVLGVSIGAIIGLWAEELGLEKSNHEVKA